jgi:hypothetical protein
MLRKSSFGRTAILAASACLLLLAGCVSAPGTYPDPNGPRNGDGQLVDPRTGISLPGQPELRI